MIANAAARAHEVANRCHTCSMNGMHACVAVACTNELHIFFGVVFNASQVRVGFTSRPFGQAIGCVRLVSLHMRGSHTLEIFQLLAHASHAALRMKLFVFATTGLHKL